MIESRQDRGGTSGTLLSRPVIVPPEEIESIQKDFFAQVTHLFQVL
jgi:hypothetical protein